MKSIKQFSIIILLVGLFSFLLPTQVLAYPVPPLPEDNLIVNPWFRSSSDPTTSGMDGWTPVLQDGVGWGLSQKDSNPSPEILISGKCGFERVYCGTGARWANQMDERDVQTYPGMDVYLYQVVSADPSHRKLKFFMYWVNHKVDVAEAKIYGSQSAGGQWSEVWTPFFLVQNSNPSKEDAPGRNGNPWFDTGFLEVVIAEGYPYYKVEIHARYQEAKTTQGDVGIKITGVYLATEHSDAPVDATPQAVILDDTLTASSNRKQEKKAAGENPEETEAPEKNKSRDGGAEWTPEPESNQQLTLTQPITQITDTATATLTSTPHSSTAPLEGGENTGASPTNVNRIGLPPFAVIGISSMGVIIILAAVYAFVNKKHS